LGKAVAAGEKGKKTPRGLDRWSTGKLREGMLSSWGRFGNETVCSSGKREERERKVKGKGQLRGMIKGTT